jgi:protein O-GlcNAc transferase
MVLSTDLLIKIKNLFIEKKYTELEFNIESLGSLDKLPSKILMFYAVSKALNPNSKKNDFKISAFHFEKIYSENKSNREAFYNLIFTSVKAVYFKYLEPHIIKEYEKNKSDTKILEGLAKMNFFYNNMIEVTNYYEKLLKINPNFISVWSTFLASLNYHYFADQKKYLNYCEKFDKTKKIDVKDFIKDYQNDKIKIGFLSADLRSHSVSFFLKDILSKMDKNDFELHALSNLDVNDHDDMTLKLKSTFDNWHEIKSLSDRELVNFSRSLKLDILIDLAGYTYNNRVNVLRSRCAPAQISWCGYCNTTGIRNMDFLIADPNLIKKEEENLYSEKILYMPKIWNVLSKPDNLPDVKLEKIKTDKTFIYGSFNNFTKISLETIKVWSKILNNGHSKLILKNSVSLNDDKAKEILMNKFVNEKVDITKIEIIETKTTMKEHLESYNQVDLALDTFPYPGVTTSFESILMGVPVLTMKGFNFNSRCGESINLNLGLKEFNSENEDDYFGKAIYFQKERNKLLEIKKNLRGKALKSNLFDTDGFASDFSRLLKNL